MPTQWPPGLLRTGAEEAQRPLGAEWGRGEELMHRHLGLTLVLDFTTAALGRMVPDDFKTVENLGRLAQ